MSELTLRITGQDGAARECARFAQAFTWSGDIRECARTLDFGLLAESGVHCDMGRRVAFAVDGREVFDGYIFGRGRDIGDDGSIIDVSCADRGLYLKRNEAEYKFPAMAPDAITSRICADFGIKVGALAQPAVTVRRNFPGTSLYAMIATVYTLAAEMTGERYAVRFRGESLEVAAKRKGPETLVIQPGSNLRAGRVDESVESMINQVAVHDSNGVRIATHTDAEAVKLYGLMQAHLSQSKGRDSAKEAKKLLEDNGVSQKISVTVNGNPKLVSGDCVVMREPVTGLYGLFWIDSDVHTWTKDGDYSTRLTLNFKNIMDEQEAGSLPKA